MISRHATALFRPLRRTFLHSPDVLLPPSRTPSSATCPNFWTQSMSTNIPQSATIQRSAVSRRTSRVPLRIMPLGGSVTYGVGSSDGNGYRNTLLNRLLFDDLFDDYEVCMVGSRKSGSMSNCENEGWRGYRLDQIENKARTSVPALRPNLFTINAGSNDCIQDFQVDEFGSRMEVLLEYLWQVSPLATVILSTLLLNADEAVNSRVLRVNAQIRRLAESKAAEGRRIVLADMHSSNGPQIDDLVDGTHPGDLGYQKMANVWHAATQKASSLDFFQKE
ncbi:SGNH hydrolase [Thozetella sp. PMI_491]|nr:SGNH hydrolase [Thozetella sp. PMI_491]